jgi:peptidoglycan hydrolase-like protein with peptidoglycan-binding domain
MGRLSGRPLCHDAGMQRIRFSFRSVSSLLPLVLIACGGDDSVCLMTEASGLACSNTLDDADGTLESPLAERLAALDSDLTLGARGADVAAVQEYLTKYGYFPNTELAEEYPDWRPLVQESPLEGWYDDATAEAVSRLQAGYGLERTAVVDEPTRVLMRQGRCGVPDGDLHAATAALIEKYASDGAKWSNRNLTWDFFVTPIGTSRTDDGLTLTALRTQAASMFARWAAETDVTFRNETAAAPLIQIDFGPLDGPGGTLARRRGAVGTLVSITFDTAETWTLGTPSNGSRFLPTYLLHEIGHTLGLGHSSYLDATMLGSIPDASATDVSLAADDQVGISSMYDIFRGVNAVARDIGVASITGDAWIIGTTAVGSNFQIRKGVVDANGALVFRTTNDGSAVRISVAPNGRPWVVAANGTIHRRTTLLHDSGTWEPITGPEGSATSLGCAKDIAVNGPGGEGEVWAIGCTPVGSNFAIYKRVNNVFVRTNDGAAVRIAVSIAGVPWVVASNNGIHYRSRGTFDPPRFSVNHLTDTWSITSNGAATDIAVRDTLYPWVTGTDAGIYVWNKQTGNVVGNPVDPPMDTWIKASGTGSNIAVGPKNAPWFVAANGNVSRHEK